MYEKLRVRKNNSLQLKYDVYKPDGKTKKPIYSFYDRSNGAAAKIRVANEAVVKRAEKSRLFMDDLNELREASTYSNLNISSDSIDKIIKKH